MSTLCTLDELLERLKAMPITEEKEPRSAALGPVMREGKLSSSDLINMIKSGQDWHTNMLKLVAHWIGRKLTDEEILLTANSLTLSGYTEDQTIAEMGEMIVSARSKWQALNPIQTLKESVSLIAVTLTDFLAKDIAPRELILSPIIPTQGLAMMYASPGIGKTHAALSIALAVATGSSMMGGRWTAPKPRRVLFVDGEMPAISLQDRLKLMVKNFGPLPEPDFLRIITPDQQTYGVPDLGTIEGQMAIEEHIEGVELLILDNLSSLLRNGRENEAESWLPIQSWLLSLRRRGISVLIIHHAGKGGHQRGTSKKEDLLDTVIVLKRPENYNPTYGSQFEVHYEKARGFHGKEAKAFEARLNESAMQWEVKDIEGNPLEAQIQELNNQGLSQRAIAKKVGTSPSTVNRIINSLDPPPVPIQEEIEF